MGSLLSLGVLPVEQGNTGLWWGQKGPKRVAWKGQEVCFYSLHLSKLLTFWVISKRRGRICLSSPFLLISWQKKKSRSKSLWIFFIILQDGRNRSRNIHWMLAFLRALEGMQKIEDMGALASGTFQDSWRHKADTLFDSGNHLFIHLNVHKTYLLSTYFASGTRCGCWQHGVDKDLHFGLKESLHGLLEYKEQ